MQVNSSYCLTQQYLPHAARVSLTHFTYPLPGYTTQHPYLGVHTILPTVLTTVPPPVALPATLNKHSLPRGETYWLSTSGKHTEHPLHPALSVSYSHFTYSPHLPPVIKHSLSVLTGERAMPKLTCTSPGGNQLRWNISVPSSLCTN